MSYLIRLRQLHADASAAVFGQLLHTVPTGSHRSLVFLPVTDIMHPASTLPDIRGHQCPENGQLGVKVRIEGAHSAPMLARPSHDLAILRPGHSDLANVHAIVSTLPSDRRRIAGPTLVENQRGRSARRTHATGIGNDLVITWDPDDPASDLFIKAALSVARALVIREGHEAVENREAVNAIELAARAIERQLGYLSEIGTWAETVQSNGEKIAGRAGRMGTDLARKSNHWIGMSRL